jgi:hypothetical protein
MMSRRQVGLTIASAVSVAWAGEGFGSAEPLTADVLVQKLLDNDPWGLAGATVTATLTLTDRNGKQRTLEFWARSRRYASPLSKSLIRFTAPPDLAGAGFLQIQRRDADDDRSLFLPELKRSRRLSGSLRSSSFMGTDFSFADLDQRDFREGAATLQGEDSIGSFSCYRVDVAPSRSDSPYSRQALWLRKDNFLPLKILLFDKSSVILKEFRALEVKRVSGQWFITKSKMANLRDNHVTELQLEQIVVENVPDDVFTIRELEKM